MKALKHELILLVALLATAGCHTSKISPLQGTWILERHAMDGFSLSSTITVQKAGEYKCATHAFTNSNPVFTVDSEGIFEIQDGYLIDTVTKHSEPTISVPWTIKAKIVRFEGDELIALDGASHSFTMRRLRK